MDILRHTCLHLVFGHAQRHNPCLHGYGQASGTSVFQFLQEEKNLVWEKWLVFKLENRCKLNTSLPLMSTWSRVSHMATPNCKEEWEILSLPRLSLPGRKRQLAVGYSLPLCPPKYPTHHSTCNTTHHPSPKGKYSKFHPFTAASSKFRMPEWWEASPSCPVWLLKPRKCIT